MKMRKEVLIGTLVVFLMSLSTLLTAVYAGGTGGGRRGGPPAAPEPISCVLVLAGGADRKSVV